MKKRNLYKSDRKALLQKLSSEVSLILKNKARGALVIAFVFTLSMAGLGLIISYLLLNILEYLSVKISDFIGYLVMLPLIYLFAAPAFASVRNTASAVCDGREVSMPEIFSVFSSFKSFVKSYIPIRIFSWMPRFNKGLGRGYFSNLRAAIKLRMMYSDLLKYVLDILLSFVTCFIYYILVAGPRAAVRRELMIRKIKYYNLKNNERTVNRND